MLRRVCALALVGFFMVPAVSLAVMTEAQKAVYDQISDKYGGCKAQPEPLRVARMSCIACAVEAYTGKAPSPKYLGLLGYVTARYTDLGSKTTGSTTKYETNSRGVTPLETFQRNVIRKIQAYGVCTEKIYGNVPSGMLNLVLPAASGTNAKYIPQVEGRKVVGKETSTGYTTAQEEELVKFYGFSDAKAVKAFFSPDGWENLTPAEKQRQFREEARENTPDEKKGFFSNGSYASGTQGQQGRACIQQLRDSQSSAPFNLKESSAQNQEFCLLMAGECDIDTSFCLEGGNASAPPAPSTNAPSAPPIVRPASAQ
jgi:hypothetical protein